MPVKPKHINTIQRVETQQVFKNELFRSVTFYKFDFCGWLLGEK